MSFNGIPKNEQVWVTMRPSDGSVWYITTKIDDRTNHYLYKDNGGKAERICKAKSPSDLEDKVWGDTEC